MKTTSTIIKQSILAALLFMGTTAFAEKPSNSEITTRAEKEITTEIKSQIAFPAFLLESNLSEHRAEVSFKVTECGFINLVTINSEEEKLKAEIVRQLGKIRVHADGLTENDTYKIVFRFKAL